MNSPRSNASPRIPRSNRCGSRTSIRHARSCALLRLTLTADIAIGEGRVAEAVTPLREATAIEDALAYDEPHLWLAPTRHALGATLLAAGRAAEAERIYREDLRRYPENGWSLVGLAEAQRRQGHVDAAKATEARFRAVWRDADVALAASRF